MAREYLIPMNGFRLPLAVWLVLSLTAAPQVAAGPADTWQIVPGQSIGPVRVGASVFTLSQVTGWGQPDQTHTAGSITYQTYARQRVTIALRDGQVVLILTSNERYRTDKGVGVGQTASAVTAAYGPPASGGEERVQWYDALGLVVVTGANTVIRIGVFDPKTFRRAILADDRPARDVFLTARPPKYGPPTATKADANAGASTRTALITVTLKNASPAIKVLNPNFLLLADREGKTYKFDPSTFRQTDACRSTISVRPGETGSCSVVFVIPAGQNARAVIFNDGGSTDEFYF